MPKKISNIIIRMSYCILAISVIFAGQAVACYCNDSGQVEGGETCSDAGTCTLYSTSDSNEICGENGCSAVINGNECYCFKYTSTYY